MKNSTCNSKRNTDRDGLPEGEAYGGFVTCTLSGMPGDELLRWAAYSHSREDGEIRIFQKDQPDQQAAFALRFVEGNCIRLQRKVDRISIPTASSFCLPQEH
ncbi:hypothetical protein NXW50_05360 [Bacteroides thetaiotaomicron]|nr:hypothetical protein [Bacteroides thetaiotaomicron]